MQWDLSVLGGGASPGSKLWVVEYPDALVIVFTDTTNAFHPTLFHGGRITQPIMGSSVAALGMDGLGLLAGSPNIPVTTGTADRLLSASITTDAGLFHYETNNWNPRAVPSNLNPNQLNVADGGDGEANSFPLPYPATCDIGGLVSSPSA